jgi:hypothetical protein
LTPGASITSWSYALASRASAAPNVRARSGSNDAASAIEAGKAVAGLVFVRIPIGPSTSFSGGVPARSTPGT